MRACLLCIFLLEAALALSVLSKTHGKHHQKISHTAKEKDAITEEANRPQVLPTLVTFEASSQEQEDEGMNSEDVNVSKRTKSTAVLLSEDELVDLLKKEEDVEESKVEDDEAEGKEAVVIPKDEKGSGKEKLDRGSEVEVIDQEEVKKKQKYKKTTTMSRNVKKEKPNDVVADRDEQVGFLEETEGSTESELPADVDYAADGEILPLQIDLTTSTNPTTDDDDHLDDKKEIDEKDLPVAEEDHEQDAETSDAGELDQNKDKDSSTKSVEINVSNKEPETNKDPQELKSSVGPKLGSQMTETEEENNKIESRTSNKRKARKPKKNQRARKHSPQRSETHPVEEQNQRDSQELESSSSENIVNKTKRRRAGKWGPLVGVNPVQIRASVDLYPGSSFGRDIRLSKTLSDPCDNFRCKRGKTCKLDADKKPGCVCQQPLDCPNSVNEFDHVCGTDNKTYNTSCELFATKCNLEGTKRGHRLHLDYTGPCKVIPPCMDNELIQFPLRMRDWLKNVLLQLYEHDSILPGFLTQKQRFRVKKIFENERRLHVGDHPVELLAQDFEKNYNMYIYPVHWQFAQLDQHPSDRFLSHSELAPLRVPLVPMEHCTSRFFQECDADKDKQVSFREWTSCFGIKEDDMDVNLLF